jgi:hypothetical protein
MQETHADVGRDQAGGQPQMFLTTPTTMKAKACNSHHAPQRLHTWRPAVLRLLTQDITSNMQVAGLLLSMPLLTWLGRSQDDGSRCPKESAHRS